MLRAGVSRCSSERGPRRSAGVSASAASSRMVGCLNTSITLTARAGLPAQPGHHLGGEQRVPAEVEEVVVDADHLDAEQFAPDRGQGQLGRRAGGDELDPGVPARDRRRQGPPVQLAAGAERQGGQGDEAAGTM